MAQDYSKYMENHANEYFKIYKTTILKVCISLFFSFIFSFIIVLLFTTFHSTKGLLSYLTDYTQTNYTLNDVSMSGYEQVDDSTIVSTGNDGQLLLSGVDSYVHNITIDVTSSILQNTSLQIFYSETPGYFDSDQTVDTILYQGQPTISLSINEYVSDLRFDFGNSADERFQISNISINTVSPWSMLFSNQIYFLRSFLVGLLIFFVILHFILPIRPFYTLLEKKRYVIGITVILFVTLLNINGSSLDSWSAYIPNVPHTTLFGETRDIRTDEWDTFTAMNLSQQYTLPDAYSSTSNILRADDTSTQLVYGQPVKNIWIVFRPFLVGFILFGSSHGLAFFWIARLVSLFLISYEFFMMLLRKKKILSFSASLFITLSPLIQWWYAINGLIEMLIAVFGSILLLHKFLSEKSKKKKLFYTIGIYYFACLFVFTLYPAWMIPLCYLLVILIISTFYENRKKYTAQKSDLLYPLVFVLCFSVTMISFFYPLRNELALILNTSYPGERFSNGGNGLSLFFLEPLSFFTPFSQYGLLQNASESAVIFSFFPLGLILSAIQFFKYKKRDFLSLLLCICSLFFAVYIIVGFSSILSTFSLLSMTTYNRCFFIFSLCQFLLLMRTISLTEVPANRYAIFLLPFALIIPLISHSINSAYLTSHRTLIASYLYLGIWLLMIYYEKIKYLFCIIVLLFTISTGATVNPIQLGITTITDAPLGQTIQELASQNPDKKWLVIDPSPRMGNYPIMFGAPTINSTNTYPDLKRFETLDPQHEYYDVYNRYAFIQAQLVSNNSTQDQFELLAPDAFVLSLQAEDLVTLDVTYILTMDQLDAYNTPDITFECISYCDGYYIYQLNNA